MHESYPEASVEHPLSPGVEIRIVDLEQQSAADDAEPPAIAVAKAYTRALVVQ